MNPGSATRVVMVSASFHPHVGGAEKQALGLSGALRRRGVAVTVLTRRLPGLAALETVEGVPVRRLWCAGRPGGLLNALTFMASLFLTLWDESSTYDAIHVHLAASPALAAALAGRFVLKPVLVKVGGGRGVGEFASSDTAAGRVKLAALAYLSPRFLAVTRALAEECRERMGEVRVEVLPNGVDGERYKPAASEAKAGLRASLGWPKSGFALLFAGRLSIEKNLPWFLRALAEAPAAGRVFVALMGEGPQRPLIEEAMRSLPPGKVLLQAPRPDIERAYQAADAFVLPSYSEGLSNALLEAMASGLPLLASRVGGAAELVQDGVTGRLFESGDAASMGAALDALTADPAAARRLGEAGRSQVLASHSLDALAARYEKLYRGEDA